jgi:hypothetical protein
MMIEGSGSITLTNGSGSGRPKNLWIRIRNTAALKKKGDIATRGQQHNLPKIRKKIKKDEKYQEGAHDK